MKAAWTIRRLGELGSAVRESAQVRADVEYELWSVPSFVNDEPAIAIGKDIGSAKLRVRAGDVLICKINPRINRVWLVREPAGERDQIASTEWLVFRPSHHAGLSPGWLIHFASAPTFREWIASEVSGATGSHTRAKADGILQQEIPVPPLAEQERVIGILDEALDGVATAKANAERSLKNARSLFESQLQSVFTQRGEGWSKTILGAEIDLLAGFAFKSAGYTKSDDTVRLLRGDNIVQGSLRWEDVMKWPASDTSEYSRYQIHEHDVVLAMDRPWVKAGLKHAMVTKADLPCLLVQRTARLRSGSKIESRFLMYLIGSAAFTRHILGVQTGIGVPHISGEQIKEFAFLRPPMDEQRRLAANLDRFQADTQRLESVYQRKLAALEALKRSLLHHAFAGHL